MDILYKDRSIIVCVKRPGELSQAGKPGEKSLLTALEEQHGAPIYPVHRLDRETGGLMVYARTKAAAARLSDAIARHELEKEYVCIVRGAPQEDEGEFRDLLLHDKQRNKAFVVDRMRGGVKEAVLNYRILKRGEDTALMRVRLQTGRTHQIRVQFSSRKMPLVGDGKYGGGKGELALWSCRLAFRHPATDERMEFERMPTGGVWAECELIS
ncbi:MAG: RluA family pseudouridine synthase [Oscillospiraceae bacterium]|nr:RluA family pseudouridine synthase [Oscillospiraceae bacterium]